MAHNSTCSGASSVLGLPPFSIPISTFPFILLAFFLLALYLVHPSLSRKSPLSTLPGPPRLSLLTGNLTQLFSPKGLPFHEMLSEVYGGVVRVWGFWGERQVYVGDVRAVGEVLKRDGGGGGGGKGEGEFEETDVFIECNKVIFGPGLVSTTGALHRRQRKLAMPMFSTAQLGRVRGVFFDVAEKLVSVLEREVRAQCQEPTDQASCDATANGEVKSDTDVDITSPEKTVLPLQGTLDMSEWSSRVSLEAAGRAILGYSFDPLDSRVANVYTRAIKELIPTLFSLALIRNFAPFLVKLGPAWFRRWVVERVPSRRVRKVVESSDVMDESARRILSERRAALSAMSLHDEDGTQIDDHDREGEPKSERSGRRDRKPKDVISMLLQANDRAAPEEKMSDEELTGQMTVLIFGAQDTTSSALSRVFSLLAENEEVQRRVREEVRRGYLFGGEFGGGEGEGEEEGEGEDGNGKRRRLDPDVVMKMPWLDAVIKETLRMYPPVPFVRRVCTKATALPYVPHPSLSTPGQRGKQDLKVVDIPKGTTLFLSIVGCNRSREVWGEDAGVWKPERWICGDGEHEKGEEVGGGGGGEGGGEGGGKKKPYRDDVKVPGAFNGMLSFLGGGRSCVGSRFAMMEMKIILATVLSKMYFKPTEDEVVWNLSQIISPSVRRRVIGGAGGENGEEWEETKGLPLVAVLDDLTV